MGEILSHSEVEAILSALDFSSAETASPEVTSGAVPDVRLYDFEHPIPLRDPQMDALRLTATVASQSLQLGLQTLLRTPVVANFLAVEQSTFRDYLATAENPTCLAVLTSSNSTATWLVDMSRSLAFTMVDCLLGGTPSATVTSPSRPFTGVEVRLLEKSLTTILRDLAGDLLPTQALQLQRLVSDGALISEATSNEAVALVSFEIVCGPSQGLIQLCAPWKEVAMSSPLGQMGERLPNQRLRLAAAKIPITVTARIARLKLSAGDLANLSLGDVLLTDADALSEMSLEVEGREIFRGTAGQSHDRKVILLTAPSSIDSRDESGL